MDKKELQSYSDIFKAVFGLEKSPVAIRRVQAKDTPADKNKARMCRAILEAAEGKTSTLCRENNACFGANWHLGFSEMKDPKVLKMVKQFVVEGEKLFSSYQALDNLLSQVDDVPYNKDLCFIISPLEAAEAKPELVIFACNPEQACR